MPTPTSHPSTPTTMQERWELLEKLTNMIVQDFGSHKDGEQPDPFKPADVARHGLLEIACAYQKFAETDQIADQIVKQHEDMMTRSDNLEGDGLYWGEY